MLLDQSAGSACVQSSGRVAADWEQGSAKSSNIILGRPKMQAPVESLDFQV